VWTIIKYVGFVLSSISFLVAFAAALYRRKLLKRENQINRQDPQRIRLDEQTLRTFDIDSSQYTREEQYNQVLNKIGRKARRVQKIARLAFIIGILFAVLTFLAPAMPNPSSTPPPPGPSQTPTSIAGNLLGEIEEVAVVPGQGGNVQVFIHLSIKNAGSPTSVPRYTIRINHASSKSINFNGPPEEINGRYTIPQAGGNGTTVIQPHDSIIRKTQRAIGGSEKVSGWLSLALPLPKDVLSQPGIRYTVSFADVAGKTYQAVYEVQ
jgi:hypothetical protein